MLTHLFLLSKDPVLAELLHSYKDQIVGYHEHDSLLDHKEEEALSEEDRKAAWAEYEAEKKVCSHTNPVLLYKCNDKIYHLIPAYQSANVLDFRHVTSFFFKLVCLYLSITDSSLRILGGVLFL